MIADRSICKAFARGMWANRADAPLADNPWPPSDERWEAWGEGWLEEDGPAYIVTERGKMRVATITAIVPRATLADIWPNPTHEPGRG